MGVARDRGQHSSYVSARPIDVPDSGGTMFSRCPLICAYVRACTLARACRRRRVVGVLNGAGLGQRAGRA